ncbi:hypothetical protein PJ208_01650, partial [Escherichia coli]
FHFLVIVKIPLLVAKIRPHRWRYWPYPKKPAIARVEQFTKERKTLLHNTFKYAVLYKMMVRLICGLSFYARSIYLYSRQ